MKVTWITLGVLLLIVWKLHVDRVREQKTLREKLLRAWGVSRDEQYSQKRMTAIAEYYQAHRNAQDIDDITWNDLDMDRIYQQLNHTESAMGQEIFYALLRQPTLSEETLAERERLIRYFSENEAQRLQLQAEFAAIGKQGEFSVYGYLNRVGQLKKENGIRSVLQLLAFIFCVTGCFIKPEIMIFAAVIVAVVNMVTYYLRKTEMLQYYRLFAFIVKMVHFSMSVASLKMDALDSYFDTLRQDAGKFRKFCRGSWLVVSGGDMDGSLMDVLMDYVRLLTHVDIIKFQSMAREVLRRREELLRMYETIGFLDSMIAAASCRAMDREYCVPELVHADGRAFFLETQDVYHPLLKTPVKNSLDAHKNILLTGSNASGKSTFIKTIAINAILAQTVHTVLAGKWRANYFRIYSSMALRDDIMHQESYYMVEIRSLKRIVDQAVQEGVPVLCFIDEVLRGTNTVERIAASTEILHMLAESNALCFAATHDIELTDLLQDTFDNYHFEEQVQGNDVVFDYRLRSGKTMTRNAIQLLRMIGYDPEIVQRAQARVQGFLEQGIWHDFGKC